MEPPLPSVSRQKRSPTWSVPSLICLRHLADSLRAAKVFKSPNAFAAFSAAKTLIDSLISGKVSPLLAP